MDKEEKSSRKKIHIEQGGCKDAFITNVRITTRGEQEDNLSKQCFYDVTRDIPSKKKGRIKEQKEQKSIATACIA